MIFLSGGGYGSHNPDGYRLFLNQLDRTKPILYVTFANLPHTNADYFSRFVGRMIPEGFTYFRLCDTTEFFENNDLSEYTAIFCEGGNTFRLMKCLKEHNGVQKIREYLANGGNWYGTSAGAVVGGADVQPIIYMDPNDVMLRDTSALDLMDGWSTVAHYNNSSDEELNCERNAAVAELAKDFPKLVALAEETTIVIDPQNHRKYMLGQPCLVYENGKERIIGDGEEF